MLLSDTTCGFCNKILNCIPTIEKEAWLLIARGRASSLKDKQAVYQLQTVVALIAAHQFKRKTVCYNINQHKI
jgi:hypothetical protein